MILFIDSLRIRFAYDLSMLIIAMLLSHACPSMLHKDDLHK